MSRIGLSPIEIPEGVEISIKDDRIVTVKGPKGELQETLVPEMKVIKKDNEIIVERESEKNKVKALHGLSRTLIYNMIVGVTEGYEKTLLIKGTGYRAAKEGNTLVLNLGYSHQIRMEDPEGITTEVPDQTTIKISGSDKQLVGNHSAKIRAQRGPEPYKGKGVRYSDEHIRRKVGKAGAASE